MTHFLLNPARRSISQPLVYPANQQEFQSHREEQRYSSCSKILKIILTALGRVQSLYNPFSEKGQNTLSFFCDIRSRHH